MKNTLLLTFVLASLLTRAQDKPTIYIDIPTQQKPWNHIDWNRSNTQFQFAIVTDRTGGHRPGIFPLGISKLNLLQPEFVMSVGDLIEGYTEDTSRLNAEWKEFMGFIDKLEAPFFYVPGNHDITNAVMAEKWKELFGVSYYHFVYNDVLFLCLNSEDNHRGAGRGTIDDAQYEYIKKTLEENQDVKWTLVFLHQPLWVQEDTKRWQEVEALLANRNHNVFAGHYHRYWKSERNNGKYIALATTGGGSQLRGRAYGEFDHVVWVTMTEEGPILANLFLNGIWDENVVTEDMVDLVRNRPFPVQIEPSFIPETSPKEVATTIKVTNDSDTRMTVQLNGQIHPSMHYQLEESTLTVEPNDVAQVTMTLKNPDATDIREMSSITLTADVTYEFETQPNVSFSNSLNYAPNYQYTINENMAVKLDGNLKEWKDGWQTIKKVEGKPFDFDGDDDCSIRFATAYDQEYLYLAIDIRDEEIYINENGPYWQQDAVIVGLDARPAHISANNQGEGRGKDWIAYLRTFKETDPVYAEASLPTEIKSAFRKTKTSIQLELAIPVSYLDKMQGKAWENIRLGVGYYDFDAGGEESTTHFWYPAWNAKEDVPGSGMLYKK